MYNSDITLQLILHKLREDLLKYRKCFSGAQLVNWVMKNPDLVKPLGMILLTFFSRIPGPHLFVKLSLLLSKTSESKLREKQNVAKLLLEKPN